MGVDGTTLGQALAGKGNALNFLRLVFAVLVIVSHSWLLTGRTEPAFAGLTLGGWAVMGFFAISGYLIPRARLRTDLATFLVRRGRRIYPGFWVCCAVVAFAVTPTIALLTDGSYDVVAAARYVFLNGTTFIFQPIIGAGAAGSTALTNAPTWTLAFELLCYGLAGALLTLDVVRRHATTVAVVLYVVASADGPDHGPDRGAVVHRAVRCRMDHQHPRPSPHRQPGQGWRSTGRCRCPGPGGASRPGRRPARRMPFSARVRCCPSDGSRRMTRPTARTSTAGRFRSFCSRSGSSRSGCSCRWPSCCPSRPVLRRGSWWNGASCTGSWCGSEVAMPALEPPHWPRSSGSCSDPCGRPEPGTKDGAGRQLAAVVRSRVGPPGTGAPASQPPQVAPSAP